MPFAISSVCELFIASLPHSLVQSDAYNYSKDAISPKAIALEAS
jgi:hypothetical protein